LLDLRLRAVADTHLDANHIIGFGALRDRTPCIAAMGEGERTHRVLAAFDPRAFPNLAYPDCGGVWPRPGGTTHDDSD
jgi:glyoxylase-like metal-dependent hydrolase (beta-lactamase superfamily II)